MINQVFVFFKKLKLSGLLLLFLYFSILLSIPVHFQFVNLFYSPENDYQTNDISSHKDLGTKNNQIIPENTKITLDINYDTNPKFGDEILHTYIPDFWRTESESIPHLVRFSPDGTLIAIASANGTVYFLDLRYKTLTKFIDLNQANSNYSIAKNILFSADSSLLITSTIMNVTPELSNISLWNVTSKALVKSIIGVSNDEIALSPDNTILAVVYRNAELPKWIIKQIVLFNLTTDTIILNQTLIPKNLSPVSEDEWFNINARSLNFIENGTKLASFVECLYDVDFYVEIDFILNKSTYTSLVGFPTLREILSGTQNYAVHILSQSNNYILISLIDGLTELKLILSLSDYDNFKLVSISPDLSRVALAKSSSLILKSVKTNTILLDKNNFYSSHILFSPDGTIIASISSGGSFFLLNAVPSSTMEILTDTDDTINSLVTSDQYIITAQTNSLFIRNFNKTYVNTIKTGKNFYSLSVSANNRFVAGIDQSNSEIHVWDIETRELVQSFNGSNYKFSSIGSNIAILGVNNTINEYEIGNTTPFRTFTQNHYPEIIEFSLDDEILLLANSTSIHLLNNFDGNRISSLSLSNSSLENLFSFEMNYVQRYSTFQMKAINFIPDSNTVFSISEFCAEFASMDFYSRCAINLLIWNLTDLTVIGNSTLIDHDFIDVSVSSDGKFICTTHNEPNKMYIWDAETGEILQNLTLSIVQSEASLFRRYIYAEFSSNVDKLIFSDGDLIKILDFFVDIFPVFLDLDTDGMRDTWEYSAGLDPTNFWDKFDDNDQDGLINIYEFSFKTDPFLIDSNQNGISDKNEFKNYFLYYTWLIFKERNIRDINSASVQTVISDTTSSIHEEKSTILSNPGPAFFIDLYKLISLLLIVITFISTFFILLTHFGQKNTPSEKFTASTSFQSNNIVFLRDLYHKTLIGLRNERLLINQNPDNQSEILEPDVIESDNLNVLVHVIPPDIRQELKELIKGRSILILVELAFQPEKNSHSAFLSKILCIPRSTVTKELKKLLDLNYIEVIISNSTLFDNRYKFYKLTFKGVLFLHLLKETLSITIMNMDQEQDISIMSY